MPRILGSNIFSPLSMSQVRVTVDLLDALSNVFVSEMRMLFKSIRTLVEQRYRTAPGSVDNNNNLPWQSVSAFVFLRFIVPAILHPHLFGLCPGML